MRSSKQRSRGNKNRNNRPSGGNIINRVFDSSGPDGKVRGTPQQIIEKYNQLYRDAQLAGDRVNAENFAQHAEHYTRMLAEAMREVERAREEHEQANRERQAERDRERDHARDRDRERERTQRYSRFTHEIVQDSPSAEYAEQPDGVEEEFFERTEVVAELHESASEPMPVVELADEEAFEPMAVAEDAREERAERPARAPRGERPARKDDGADRPARRPRGPRKDAPMKADKSGDASEMARKPRKPRKLAEAAE